MTKKPADYQTLQSELDALITQLQDEDIGIDEALKCYEAGLAKIAELQQQLDAAEHRVREIKANFET